MGLWIVALAIAIGVVFWVLYSAMEFNRRNTVAAMEITDRKFAELYKLTDALADDLEDAKCEIRNLRSQVTRRYSSASDEAFLDSEI